MIRHRQSPHRPGEQPGNCLQASLAGILDEPVIGRIPHVAWLDPEFSDDCLTLPVPNPHAWWGVVLDTVASYGCRIELVSSPSRQTALSPDTFPLRRRLTVDQELVGVVGCGPSPRGPWGHAVIVDDLGHLVHDPHPSGAGVPFLDEVWMVVRPSYAAVAA